MTPIQNGSHLQEMICSPKSRQLKYQKLSTFWGAYHTALFTDFFNFNELWWTSVILSGLQTYVKNCSDPVFHRCG